MKLPSTLREIAPCLWVAAQILRIPECKQTVERHVSHLALQPEARPDRLHTRPKDEVRSQLVNLVVFISVFGSVSGGKAKTRSARNCMEMGNTLRAARGSLKPDEDGWRFLATAIGDTGRERNSSLRPLYPF